MSKHINHLGPSEKILSRKEIDPLYHCNCKYCDRKKFKGEIIDLKSGKYYSNRIRKGYYVEKPGTHLDVGQFVGYRWAIQNLCPKNGWVLDPTAGTGTALVEAINNGRNGIGVELEYPEIGLENLRAQKNSENEWIYIPGDARDITSLLKSKGVKEESVDLIINSPPYPTVSSISSDAPERKSLIGKPGNNKTFDYIHPDNIGIERRNKGWEDSIRSYFTQSVEFLKPGGFLVILVKDLVRNKKAVNLHGEIVDLILEDNFDLEYYGFFIHRHIPTTLFINTYQKRFPNVKIPLHQTGIILQKQ